MKLCGLHLFLTVLGTSLGQARDADAQGLLDRTVTLRLSNQPLHAVLGQLEKTADVKFTYVPQVVSAERNVTLDVRNERLAVVLDRLLKPRRIGYQVAGAYIILNRLSTAKLMPIDELQVREIPIQRPADLSLSGRVVDEAGTGLPGVSIQVKNTSRGTVTDASGNYRLDVANESAVLVFSSIGYLPQEIQVGTQRILNVTLAPDTKALSEVVVVGYGTQKKVNLTGAVDMVTAADLQSRPITATSTGLQGLLPGVTISNFQARPGQTGSAIRIRGVGTLGNSNPLVLIDGIEDRMDNINPEDIESVSVLKDAASASIYGSRGANGVILITTKRGKKDAKASLSYSGYVGTQMPTRLPEFLGSPEYMEFLNEALANVGRPPTFKPEEIETARNGTDPNYFANTNWIDEIYRASAPQQQHNINLNGGAGPTSYYLSYGYLAQQGLVVGDAFGAKRHNLRMKLSTQLIDRLTLEANLGYVDRTFQEPASGVSGNGGLIYTAHRITPLVPARFTSGGWGYGGGSANPVAIAHDGGTNSLAAQEFIGNFNGTIQVTKGLRLRGQYGLVLANSKRDIFTRKITYNYPETGAYWYASAQYNSLSSRDFVSRQQSLIAQADYERQFGKSNVQLLVGYSQEWNRTENFAGSRQNFISEAIQVLDGGTLNQLNSGDASHWALRSGFARLNYTFADRYLFEANVRYDGSSRFARENRFGAFPSVSAGWRLSEERFMKQVPFVHEAKLRASWGQLGNQYVSSLYGYLSNIEPVGTMPIGNVLTPAFAQTLLPNPNLRWETVTMTNVGLDLQFLSGKLAFTADWYVKKTNDILVRIFLPDVLGLTESDQNGGKVENRGWETSLTYRDQLGSLRYGLTAILSDVRNQVTSLGGMPPSYGDQIRQVGFPIDAYYGLVADGIAQAEDFDYNEGTKRYTPKFPVISGDAVNLRPGDVKYRDLNGDGQITLDADRRVIGSNIPRYTFSLRPDFAWKGIDFSFFLQGVGKADGYLQGSARHAYNDESAYPQTIHRDRWTPDNPGGSYPRFTYQQGHNQRFSSFWLENAAYLRLKNIQLGYTLPKAWTDPARIDRLRVYVSADNLLTATRYFRSYDPESPISNGGFYPQVKTIVAGLQFNLK